MQRSAFLATVRDAARAGRAYRVSTRSIPPGTGYVGTRADRCEHFASEVRNVGGHAHVVANDLDASAAIASLLTKYCARRCLTWQHPLLERLQMAKQLESMNINSDEYASLSTLSETDQRQRVLSADVGITSCEWAIAETGTLVMCHRPGRERVTSLVPPVHVAIVDEAQILPDLFDVFERFDSSAMPANIALITGPSKTGDIELQLTTGVHGPKHWHVIVVRGA